MTSTLPGEPPGSAAVQPPADDSPLVQMSVHSLPDPREAERTRQGRWKMLLVLAVCAAPVLASYFTYYVVRPQARVNYGELIDPPRALPSAPTLALAGPEGEAVPPERLRGQWLLVSVGGGDCDQRCEKQLYWARQIRESLGKDKDKVDRVWLIDDGRPARPALLPAMKGGMVLRADRAALAQWLAPANGHALGDHWYLVDPHGMWMMRFPAQAEPRKVQKDLTRLIRAAASWDQPGRP